MLAKDIERKKKIDLCIIKQNIKYYKYSLLVTLVFILTTSYVSFVIDNPARGSDALYYYFAGKQILFGDRENVLVPNAPIGGPVLFASIDTIFHDTFFTIKLISLLSGTGVVFLSYCIIRNIFNSNVALLGQLIVAVNPFLHFQTIFPFNEMFPLFLLFFSFYVITKKQLMKKHLIITGLLVGASFMFRYQALPIFLSLLIFLLIRNKEFKKNLLDLLVLGIFFLIGTSPLFVYNISTFDNIIDSDPNFYLTTETVYRTTEWQNTIQQNYAKLSPYEVIFLDFDLFLKNYFYNLFFHNPSRIFNLDFSIDNISPFPVIPFFGIIPIFGGLIYSLKPTLNKNQIFLLIGISSIITIFLFITNNFSLFFAIIIIPLITLGVISFKKIEKNFLPLLTIPIVFFLFVSIAPINRPDYFFSIWIVFPILTSLFIVECIPKIIKRNNWQKQSSNNFLNKSIIIFFVILIFVSNIGFSYKLMSMIEYGDKSFDGLLQELVKIFKKDKKLELQSIEKKQIGELLAKQENIEKSYVMSSDHTYAYYANSKSLYVLFNEGNKNDTIQTYITRSTWTNRQYFISNIQSYPLDRNDLYKPIPDYLIYGSSSLINQIDDLRSLGNPNDAKIPSNFEVLYFSNKTGTVVYKIHHKT